MPQDSYYNSRDRRGERDPYASRGREREYDPPHRPQRRKRRSAVRTAALVVLYVAAVIGVSILLACVGWTAAGDVLALNKPEKSITWFMRRRKRMTTVRISITERRWTARSCTANRARSRRCGFTAL